MNIKKLGIAGVLGFFAMALVGGLTFELFYANHMGSMAQQYSDVLTFPPNMAPAMFGGVFYIFVITYIYDRMGVDSAQSGAVTGAWFGCYFWKLYVGCEMYGGVKIGGGFFCAGRVMGALSERFENFT